MSQIYIGYPAALREPPRQLKAFASVRLTPGQTRRVRFTLPLADFGYWNTASHAWTVAPGSYHIFAGTSSIDLPLATTITLLEHPIG